MNVFVCGEINGETAYLLPEEAHHCSRVLRKMPGDEIMLIDGKGNFYKARLETVSKKECTASILDRWEEEKKGYYLHLAVAPTKNISRFEWFIEKSIEIGVDEITPLLCEHSERDRINPERLLRVATGAVKQSLGATIPKINPLTTIDDLLTANNPGELICAHFEPDVQHLKHIIQPGKNYTILVGPEGDFSKEEIERLKQDNFAFAILGNKRLRTETAGVVAAQIVSGLHF